MPKSILQKEQEEHDKLYEQIIEQIRREEREELLNEVSKPLWPSSAQADLLRSTDQLPMDEASRMARAKELGFDDQEFYHLTDKDFDRFIPGGPSGVDDQGAVFVRPDPSRQQSSHNVVFTSEGAREIPVRIRRQETLYIDEFNRKEMIDRFKLNSEFPWIVKTEEARRLRDIGFDNVELELDGKVEEIAILDPKNIRSRFAGFDPAKRGSAKLDKAHGGPVHALAEGGLASMAPEARGMFGKPHPMVKEPRLTDLGPGTNPGVASLCGVARNMNRSMVA